MNINNQHSRNVNLSPPPPQVTSGSDNLFIVVTSFKLCLLIFIFALFVFDLLWSWLIPASIMGTLAIFIGLKKFKIPPADEQSVKAFFGPEFRPHVTRNAEPVSLRSRLQSATPHQDLHHNTALTIIGHRGAGLDAPENSISAFRQCKSRGCISVEFDVTRTKDFVPVVFHDDNLLRIAGIDRDIKDITWDELRLVDISVLHPLGERFRGEKVPTFEEAVTCCLDLNLKFFMDLKDDDEKVVEAVLSTYAKYPEMYSKAVITTFNPSIVYQIRSYDPKIIGCLSWRPGYSRFNSWNATWDNLEPRHKFFVQDIVAIVRDFFDAWALNSLYWWFLGLSALLMNKDCITKESTYRWTKRGMRIYAWTVNSPLEKLHLVQNVHLGYLTDTLDGGDLTSATLNTTTFAVHQLSNTSAEPGSNSSSFGSHTEASLHQRK